MRVSVDIDFEFNTKKTPKLPGRVPTISRMMALAHFYDDLLRSRAVDSVSDIGRLESVSQQRISQILSLLLLAPEIQEAILILPIEHSGDQFPKTERMIQLAKEIDFENQIERFPHYNDMQ